jgi:hypothetical protein
MPRLRLAIETRQTKKNETHPHRLGWLDKQNDHHGAQVRRLGESVELICVRRAPNSRTETEERLSSLIRVPVADDFGNWRRQIHLLLQSQSTKERTPEKRTGEREIRTRPAQCVRMIQK